MPKSLTPVTITEDAVLAADSNPRIVARFADWEDAVAVARRWSEGKTEVFYMVRFNDGFTIGKETFLNGRGGDYVETKTAKGRAYDRKFRA